MKLVLPVIAVLTAFVIAGCEKQNTSSPYVGIYKGEESVYKASHGIPPNAGSYPKTIEVLEKNGQLFSKDDSITVMLDYKGSYEHFYNSSSPEEKYTYTVEIRNDSLFKHFDRNMGTLWVFAGVKQK